MDHAALVAAMQEQRRVWVDLDEAKGIAVCMLRPTETDMPSYIAGVKVNHVVEAAVDWRGVTEAVLLGEAIGGPTPVPFAREVWSEAVRDRMSWALAAVKGLAKSITSHKATTDAVKGNSSPSSTSSPASRSKTAHSRRSSPKRTR